MFAPQNTVLERSKLFFNKRENSKKSNDGFYWQDEKFKVENEQGVRVGIR